MAQCIAKCIGSDQSRDKPAHKLGSVSARGEANTWSTFATAFVKKDGSGYIEVTRDGKKMHRFEFPAEGDKTTEKQKKGGKA